MAEKPKKAPKFTSPKGTFKYPRLNEPDTKFKPAGEYSVKLILDPEEDAVKALIKKLSPLHHEAVEAGQEAWDELKAAAKKNNPFKTNDLFAEDYDDQDEKTGLIVFNMKMTASGSNKKTGKEWSRSPVIFDSKGVALPKPPSIWGGTIGKVSFETMPYFTATAGAGMSLRLSAVQVIDLVSGGGSRDASEYGFGEEEGYEGEAEAPKASASSNDDDGDDDEDPFT